MNLSEFDFDLPYELIAQQPPRDRDDSRLFVYDRKTKTREHKIFTDILDIFGPSDVLVMNNSRVLPARILFEKKEILLVEQIPPSILRPFSVDFGGQAVPPARGEVCCWKCMVRGGKFFTTGRSIEFDDGTQATVDQAEANGLRHIIFQSPDFRLFLEQYGQMPTPPYIQTKLQNAERYQTVYAKKEGSVAAPTAGFHFTLRLLEQLKEKGVQIEFVTLHVGPGTFLPVKTENIKDHQMHAEYLELSEDVAERLNTAKKAGKSITGVGSTSLRTLESCTKSDGMLVAQTKKTDLFLYPPAEFHFVDHLLTNFHLPQSTLIMLVAAFLNPRGMEGVAKVHKLYQEAIQEKYHFYSFGDAMLIW